MTTITNPALLSYGMSTIKYGLFKSVPFLMAYWKDKNDFPKEFINLIQLCCNRMDFAATDMMPKDRKNKFIYLCVYKSDNEDNNYLATADSIKVSENNFIGYIIIRAKDIKTISQHAKLLIGDMRKFDIRSVYRIPINAYDNFKEVKSAKDTGEFIKAYELIKANVISGLVNYQDVFE